MLMRLFLKTQSTRHTHISGCVLQFHIFLKESHRDIEVEMRMEKFMVSRTLSFNERADLIGPFSRNKANLSQYRFYQKHYFSDVIIGLR